MEVITDQAWSDFVAAHFTVDDLATLDLIASLSA